MSNMGMQGGVVGGVAGGQMGGVIGGVIGGGRSASSSVPTQTRIRQGGNVTAAKLVNRASFVSAAGTADAHSERYGCTPLSERTGR